MIWELLRLKRSDGPFSGMGCIGDLDGVVSATAGAGVGAGATGGAGFQLDLLAKMFHSAELG